MGFTPTQARNLSWKRFGECKDGTVVCTDERHTIKFEGDAWSQFVASAAFCCHQWLFDRPGANHHDSEWDDVNGVRAKMFDTHPNRPLLDQSPIAFVDDEASSSKIGRAHV